MKTCVKSIAIGNASRAFLKGPSAMNVQITTPKMVMETVSYNLGL